LIDSKIPVDFRYEKPINVKIELFKARRNDYNVTNSKLRVAMKITPQIDRCRSCESPNLEVAWELENSPYGDLYRRTAKEALEVSFETLTLGFCAACKMLQLLEITDIPSTYDDYLYRSSVTNALSSYYVQTAGRLISEYGLSRGDLIVDIGSNDGTFLSGFLKNEFKVLGIEPTRENANTAELRGIYTLNEYFEAQTVDRILREAGLPKLISINYTLANIPNLLAFLNNIVGLMGEKTILSIITGYHPDQYAVNMFEYINHDHLTYLTVESVGNVCKNLNLKIIDLNRSEHKGGSIQFIISKENSDLQVQSSVGQLLQREIWLNTNTAQFTKNLELQTKDVNIRLNRMLKSLKGSTIYGVGASISTTYLCNQFGLSDKLEKLFDDDVNKIGRFAPGSGKSVQALTSIPKEDDSVALILAWQHSEKLIQRLREVGYPGRILTPLPIPKLSS
jgi:hypothetical protein